MTGRVRSARVVMWCVSWTANGSGQVRWAHRILKRSDGWYATDPRNGGAWRKIPDFGIKMLLCPGYWFTVGPQGWPEDK